MRKSVWFIGFIGFVFGWGIRSLFDYKEKNYDEENDDLEHVYACYPHSHTVRNMDGPTFRAEKMGSGTGSLNERKIGINRHN